MNEEFLLFTSFRYDPALLQVPGSEFDYAGWNYSGPSPFYLLDFNRDRMLRAATYWKWEAAVQALRGDAALERLASFAGRVVGEGQLSPLRVRITLSKDGEFGCGAFETLGAHLQNLFPKQIPPPSTVKAASSGNTVPSKEPAFEVVIDPVHTERSEYTHFKTTKRGVYDRARKRTGISMGDRKEVLLVNAEGSIMEGSITTPYFWRNGRWVTPPVSKAFNMEPDSGGQDGTTRRWALERHLAVEEDIRATSLVDGEDCWLSNGSQGFIFGRVNLVSL